MNNKELIKKIYKDHISMYKKHLLGALFCMIIVALSTAALPRLLKYIFDDVFLNLTVAKLAFFCFSIFIVFFFKGIASYGESIFLTYVGQNIISDIQNRLFKHLMTLDLNFFHNTNTGDLLSRFSNDVQMMRQAFSSTTLNIGKDSITLLALIGVMFYTDFTLACICFFVFPTAIYPILKMGRKMRKVSYLIQEELGHFTTHISQIFQSIRVVKAYNNEEFEAACVNKNVKTLFSMAYKAARTRCLASPITETIGGLAIITVIAYGGWQIGTGVRTTGDLISFILAFILAYEPLKRLSNLNANLQEGLSSAQRIFEILNTPSLIHDCANPIHFENLESDILFDNVYFSYNNSKPVLDHLSFSIPKGKTVAFVGVSGAGKSTIINLIPRFYDVTCGCIKLNNHNIKDYSLTSLRDKIALVSQEVALFDRSVFDNIAYGLTEITQDAVINAAQAANAHDFIMQLPHGYDTLVGENGVMLSGGQRQRISIARAMLKNAPILLLDEATSALDTDSERHVQAALKALMNGRTTVMVAHRLSTVVDADLIFVLDNGQVVESGTHGELLSFNGHYARLWNVQRNDHSKTSV
ncbi:MAG: Lipid A export ATP-binding/permease protein MsbA [Holosporales bacterium]